jgi:hypothetical protein
MRNLELPAPVSPCLRLFIESLLNEGVRFVSLGSKARASTLRSIDDEMVPGGIRSKREPSQIRSGANFSQYKTDFLGKLKRKVEQNET